MSVTLLAQVHLTLLACTWYSKMWQPVGFVKPLDLARTCLLACTWYCKMWQPLDLAFTATCICPSETLFFTSPHHFLHLLVSDRCLVTHGWEMQIYQAWDTRLSRGWLNKEKVTGHPKHPPPFIRDGSFKQKIVLISVE